MVDQPFTRPQAGDETLRQAGAPASTTSPNGTVTPDYSALLGQTIAQQASFAQSLRDRRQGISQAVSPQGFLGQSVARQGDVSNLAPGTDPTAVAAQAQQGLASNIQFEGNAIQAEQDATNALLDALVKAKQLEEEALAGGDMPFLIKAINEGTLTLQDLPAKDRIQVAQYAIKNGIEIKNVDDKSKALIEKQQNIEGVINGLEQLRKDAQELSVLDYINPANYINPDSRTKQFSSRKALIAQQVGRLFEKGVMSDKDRKFYTEQVLNISPIGFGEDKQRTFDRLEQDLRGSANLVTMQSPDGTIYTVDAAEAEDAVANGWTEL